MGPLLSYKNIWLSLALISIAPFSIDLDGSGVTANYFMITLLVFAPWGYRYSREGVIFILAMFVSYFMGVAFFSKLDSYFLERQFFSLVVGLVPVLLLFVRIRIPLDGIKLVIITASLIYSVSTMKNLYALGFDLSDLSPLKGLIGSQRYGFILVMGLFLSLERSARSILYPIVTVIIASGILLQFSRAGYIAVAVGAIGYVLCLFHQVNPLSSRRFVVHAPSLRSVVLFLIPIVTLFFVYEEYDQIWHTVDSMYARSYLAFAGFFDGSIQPEGPDGSSEGFRLLLWRQSIDFVLSNNPLLGSGMAGLYLVVPEYLDTGASTHNQYIDVFLRMGLLGLAVYLFLWNKLLVGFYKSSPAIFAGLLGMFVYGLFHETTKLTQGAFVFFILLNIITDKYFNNRAVKPKPGLPSAPNT